MRFQKRILLPLPVLLALAITACGGTTTTTSSTAPSSTSPMNQLQQKASQTSVVAAAPGGQLVFVPKALNVKAGMNTFVFNNSSTVDHSMVIEKPGGGELAGTPIFTGGTKKFQANLQKGTYTFYCSVPGHRPAGMVGTITVS